MSVPGAYRRITAQDIRDMTNCGLIGKYQYYGRTDLEIVRAILLYEQLRQKNVEKCAAKEIADIARCKRCHEPLPPQPKGKKGRPKEYCSSCESSRVRERHRRWRRKRQVALR